MFNTVIVEGIPGAGKTVFAEELSQILTRQRMKDLPGERIETLFIAEADEKSGNDYLADYYADPARWAFTMQVELLSRRLRAHLSSQYHVMSGRGDGVLDRSYFGDVGFAWVQRNYEYMSEREYATYKRLYHNMTSFVLYPNVCVFLDVSTGVALDRISKRMIQQIGRNCERTIDMGYLQAVGEATETVVKSLERHGTKVVHVNWDEDLSTPPQREPFIESVATLVREHQSRREFADIHDRVVP